MPPPFLPLRRRLLVAAGALPLAALGDDGPPLRLLVGFPPGGGTDAIARLLAEPLKDELGATVIVDNRPGAGGQLAAQALKAAAPDGRTVFLSHDHTISILPLVLRQPGFDPAQDFVPVAGLASFANAVALSPGTPADSLPGYVDWVRRAGGGRGAVGVPAAASVPEFLVGRIAARYGLDLVAAPYRGSAPMVGDMLGNQIAAGVGSVPDLIEAHRAGRLRIVAVLGGARQAALPEVPTLAELGLDGFEALPYYGLFAPAGTPPAMRTRWAAALARVLARPDTAARLAALGLAVGFSGGAELAERERDYRAGWARIIERSGFKPQ